MIWWIQLLLGAAILISGFLIIRNRSRLAKWQAGIQRDYGGWGAEKASSRVTSATMVIIGLGWMFAGRLFFRERSNSSPPIVPSSGATVLTAI